MNKNKKVLFGIIIIILIGICMYLYTYQDHRNIETESSSYVLTVGQLKQEFMTNDSLASRKYIDKTIEITGLVTEIDVKNKAIILEEKLFATFSDSLPKDITINKSLKCKGRFLGYDELLEEFKMDQSSITQ